MTAEDSKKDNIKEVSQEVAKDIKEISPESATIAPDKTKDVASAKLFKDDYQVVLDDRGQYLINEKYYVKIQRLNVRQVIAAWGVIQSVFNYIDKWGLALDKLSTWLILFVNALPLVPNRFYEFMFTIVELQGDVKYLIDNQGEFQSYIKSDLTMEELIDIITVIYNQEKDRTGELIKKVGPIISLLTNKEVKEIKI